MGKDLIDKSMECIVMAVEKHLTEVGDSPALEVHYLFKLRKLDNK